MGASKAKDKGSSSSSAPYNIRGKATAAQNIPRPRVQLTQKNVFALITSFIAHQARVPCPDCKTAGQVTLLDETNAAYEPPAPLFSCANCNNRFAHTIVEPVLAAIAQNPVATEQSSVSSQMDIGATDANLPPADTNVIHTHALPEFAMEFRRRLDSTEQSVKQLLEVVAENTRLVKLNAKLQDDLKALQEENLKLKAQNLKLMLPLPTNHSQNQGASASIHAVPTPRLSSAPPSGNYAAAAAKGALTTSPHPKRRPPTKRAKESAARHLMPVSEQQGFKFVYVPCRHRMSITAMRRILRTLRVDNARVLDVHFPDRQIAALLVHNDYATELANTLAKEGVTANTTFDPLDHTIIRDPEYKDKSVEERQLKAQQVHHDNMLKAIAFIREPVKFAVARAFHRANWIDDSELTAILPPYKTKEERIAEAIATAKQQLGTEPLTVDDDTDMFLDDDELTEIVGPLSPARSNSTPGTPEHQ